MVQLEQTKAAERAANHDEAQAWACLLELSQRASQGRPLTEGILDEHAGFLRIGPSLPNGFAAARPLDPAAAKLLSMFLPLVVGRDSAQLVVAHLGQSSDGYAATFCGRDKFITGEEDIRHTHRMRALFDAVLVGASTVEIDDPLLTLRLVSGRSPVRVVLDPHARLHGDYQVFTERGARTLVVTERGRSLQLPPHVEHLEVPALADGLDLPHLLRALRARGLSRIFIEGGALTIAHFLRAKLLHHLQLAVAPVRLGPGPELPAHRLSPHALPLLGQTRRFRLGRDTLFETALRERSQVLTVAAQGA